MIRFFAAVVTVLALAPDLHAGGPCSGVPGGCGRSSYRSSARSSSSLLDTGSSSSGTVEVRGYYRKDGTYVRPHTRRSPGTASESYRSEARSEPRTSVWEGTGSDKPPLTRQLVAPVSKPIPKEPTYLVTTESGRSIPAVEVIPLEDAYEIVGVTGGRTKFAKKLVKSVDLVADKKVPAKKKTGAIPSEAKVARVVDGDTIELEGGELVRLIGIDTPETVHPNKPVEWFGKEASAYTRRELEGKTVKIVVDQGNAAIKHRDKYGRVLAYIDVDGKDFNAQIVKEGYAHAYTQFPFERMKDYALYEHEARESKSGLWGEKGPPEAKPATPPKAKRAKAKPRAPPPEEDNESEDTSGSFLVPQRAAGGGYWITISSGVRHNSGCRWYHNSNGRECGPSEGRACKICGG